MKKLRVKLNTKGNYMNLNDKWFDVQEIVGKRVSLVIETQLYGKQTVDFTLSEVVEMDTTGRLN